jgi:hypothetical protein
MRIASKYPGLTAYRNVPRSSPGSAVTAGSNRVPYRSSSPLSGSWLVKAAVATPDVDRTASRACSKKRSVAPSSA